jgi:hypothetical protein
MMGENIDRKNSIASIGVIQPENCYQVYFSALALFTAPQIYFLLIYMLWHK